MRATSELEDESVLSGCVIRNSHFAGSGNRKVEDKRDRAATGAGKHNGDGQ